ncbi:hypothetical protein VTJ04DRAFT_5028 [Mycothermus thermophilus]|uniref:uncharacterized protein n=1 Tax=Humicola insolens TaxID=85995 RepID=UPI00374382FD
MLWSSHNVDDPTTFHPHSPAGSAGPLAPIPAPGNRPRPPLRPTEAPILTSREGALGPEEKEEKEKEQEGHSPVQFAAAAAAAAVSADGTVGWPAGRPRGTTAGENNGVQILVVVVVVVLLLLLAVLAPPPLQSLGHRQLFD